MSGNRQAEENEQKKIVLQNIKNTKQGFGLKKLDHFICLCQAFLFQHYNLS